MAFNEHVDGPLMGGFFGFFLTGRSFFSDFSILPTFSLDRDSTSTGGLAKTAGIYLGRYFGLGLGVHYSGLEAEGGLFDGGAIYFTVD